MRVSARGNLIVETETPGIRVMRFVRPDMWEYLDEAADTATIPLFQEIRAAVLSDLPAGWTLVVNMGLIDAVGAALYRCLLDIRRCVQARHGQLILCGLSPRHQEVFDLFRGPELFTIVTTEAEAHQVGHERLSNRERLRSQSASHSGLPVTRWGEFSPPGRTTQLQRTDAACIWGIGPFTSS